MDFHGFGWLDKQELVGVTVPLGGGCEGLRNVVRQQGFFQVRESHTRGHLGEYDGLFF